MAQTKMAEIQFDQPADRNAPTARQDVGGMLLAKVGGG